MLFIVRFLLGFVWLEFSGDFPERIINVCAEHGLVLWNLRYKKGTICGCMSIRDFKLLRKVRNGKKIKVHILKKTGIPFLKEKYKKRTGLILGAVMFLLILNLLSLFIWNIEISGNITTESKTILDACSQIGIYEGMAKKGFIAKNKRDELLLNVDSLSWASLNIEGSFLKIDVREVTEKTEGDEPVNLKASADGIIQKIDVKSGNCVVKVGDTVRTGDVLVSGIIESMYSTEFVHSIGEIIATTERTYTVKRNYIQSVTKPTGECTSRSVLNFFGIKLPLYVSAVRGEYTSKLNQSKIYLFDCKLPIAVTTRQYEFIKTTKNEFSVAEIEKQLKQDIKKQIKEDNITEYEIKNYTVNDFKDYVEITAVITAQENIAVEDKLLINSGN